MARSPRKKPQEAQTEASLIPIMSCMFLLIPALLLAMEVARHAEIPVSVPHFTHAGTTTSTDEPEPKFTVRISADGFATAEGSARAEIDIPTAGDGEHDFDALQSKALLHHAAAPDRFTVHLSAENDVPFETVIRTMDALRGPDCSLQAVRRGENAPKACAFWNVVIES